MAPETSLREEEVRPRACCCDFGASVSWRKRLASRAVAKEGVGASVTEAEEGAGVGVTEARM
jgi:hypothetical protein